MGFEATAGLPFGDHGAAVLPDQADFDPYAYVTGLADGLVRGGAQIFEGSRVESVSDGSPCRVRTEEGTLVCDRVVLATLSPILDRSLAWARTHPERSYCVAMRPGRPIDGMYINPGSPTRSLRTFVRDGEELLIIGGEGHKVGQADSHEERYEALERFGRERLDAGEAVSRWSAQDIVSADKGPLIGPVTPISSRLLMATGYGKWGMTNGTAAALGLAEVLGGGRSAFVGAFSSSRLKPLAAGPSLIKENANVGLHFVGDRIRERGSRDSEDLLPGEGAIVQHEGERAAAYRDEAGALHAVSPLCTHLWCQVRFNDAETSWDCPCHGSRFGLDGRILQGPATKPLEKRSAPPERRGDVKIPE